MVRDSFVKRSKYDTILIWWQQLATIHNRTICWQYFSGSKCSYTYGFRDAGNAIRTAM